MTTKQKQQKRFKIVYKGGNYTLAVGDTVTMRYDWFGKEEQQVVRKIIEILPIPGGCKSGYLASADGGRMCGECGREGSMWRLDAIHFVRVK